MRLAPASLNTLVFIMNFTGCAPRVCVSRRLPSKHFPRCAPRVCGLRRLASKLLLAFIYLSISLGPTAGTVCLWSTYTYIYRYDYTHIHIYIYIYTIMKPIWGMEKRCLRGMKNDEKRSMPISHESVDFGYAPGMRQCK